MVISVDLTYSGHMLRRSRVGAPGAASGQPVAALAVLVLGLPLLFGVGLAFSDGFYRQKTTPLRAMFGERYQALAEREGQNPTALREAEGSPHYLGSYPAPSIALKDHVGKQWSSKNQDDKLLVVNFWSRTCAPCLEELPSLERLARISSEGDLPIEVILVSTDAGPEAVSDLIPAKPYAIYLFDPKKDVVEKKFGTKLYPETWIIDRKGNIRLRYDGAFDWSAPLIRDVLIQFM